MVKTGVRRSFIGVVVITSLLLMLVASSALAQGQAGTTLSAYVTATPHWTKTYHWTIDKSVTPAAWNLFRGDSGTSQYTIALTKDSGTVAAYLDGVVCVTNGGDVATQGLDIVIELRNGVPPPKDLIATASVDVSAKPVLAAGESYCYPYQINIPSANIYAGGNYKVTANVTITNHSGYLGTPFGPSPSATAVLSASPTLVNDTIDVDDTNGGTWTFSSSGSVSYTKTFTCDADEGQHKNTATIRQTGQSDDATVTVNCYALEVTKDATPSYTRSYYWTIDKWADQSELTLALGQLFMVNYSVKVDATYTDSDWAVAGNISVYNPAPVSAELNSLSDVISGVGAATVDCGVTFPYTLEAGQTLECTYSADLPDAASRTNTATVTLQNYAYTPTMTATPNGTTDFSGTKSIVFGDPSLEVDKCADIADTHAGSLGEVCYPDVPKTFTYSRWVGGFNTCGEYTVENTASFVTKDTEVSGTDSWRVTVHVPCGGCTLTPGYWKTHSEFGPAPYDDTWALLPSGASTIFFKSGMTWYRVLWTPPTNGNAYFILAHQYIAAKLNILNGASSTPQVNTAIAYAETFFNTYKPTSVLSKSVRQTALFYAGILDKYNNGYIGPGHCSY